MNGSFVQTGYADTVFAVGTESTGGGGISLDCSEDAFIGLRGSGQDASGLGMGPLVGAVFNSLETATGQKFVFVDPKKQQDYKAVPIDAKHMPEYFASANSGAAMAVSALRNRIKACGALTKVVMVGYSQGAQGVYEALSQLRPAEANSVRGIVLFGDPMHAPYRNGDVGPSRVPGLLGLAAPTLPNGLPNRMHDFCLNNDPVCGDGPLNYKVLLDLGACKEHFADCAHSLYPTLAVTPAVQYLSGHLK